VVLGKLRAHVFEISLIFCLIAGSLSGTLLQKYRHDVHETESILHGFEEAKRFTEDVFSSNVSIRSTQESKEKNWENVKAY
jgi:hypothetical protein